MLVRCFETASELTIVARSLCNIAIDAPAVIRVTESWISQHHGDGPGTKMMPVVHSAECDLAQIFVGLWMYFALNQLVAGKFCSFPEFFSKGLIFRIDLKPDLLGLFDRFFDDRRPKIIGCLQRRNGAEEIKWGPGVRDSPETVFAIRSQLTRCKPLDSEKNASAGGDTARDSRSTRHKYFSGFSGLELLDFVSAFFQQLYDAIRTGEV